jgi:N-methylhydantoinase A
MPGALSAVGILLADAVRDYSKTVMLPGTAITNLGQFFTELERRGISEFTAEGLQGIAQCTLDIRYCGQGYELNVPFDREQPQQAAQAFHALHRLRYGFSDLYKPLEIVNLRLRMITPGKHMLPPILSLSPETGAMLGSPRETFTLETALCLRRSIGANCYAPGTQCRVQR